MTTLLQSFENATPSGTTISTVNTAGGTDSAFNAVSIGGASTFASSSVQAAHDSLSGAISAAAVESAYGQWDVAMGTKTAIWGRLYAYFAALPTGAVRLFQALNAGPAAAGVQLGTSGKLSITDSSSATVLTMTTAISTGVWVRVEFAITFSATVGSVEIKLFNASESSSVTATLTSPATLNTAAQATQYRFGRSVTNAAASGAFFIDDLNLNDVGYPGPLSVPVTGAGVLQAKIRRPGRNTAVREALR